MSSCRSNNDDLRMSFASFCDWLGKNMRYSPDFVSLAVYLILFVLACYFSFVMIRLLVSLIWPLFLVCVVVILLRIFFFYNPELIVEFLLKLLKTFSNVLITLIRSFLQFAVDHFT